VAAELTLDAAHTVVYHVLSAGTASFTAYLTTDWAMTIGELERVVERHGGIRQRLLSPWQSSSTGASRTSH
jgi:hypothetical protein